jgi:hypothetical protein
MNVPIKQLREVKRQLGEIHWLDYSSLDLVEAHHQLGIEVKPQAQKLLTAKLDGLPDHKLAAAIRIARRVESCLAEKTALDQLPDPIAGALSQYRDCLEAWSQGAELDRASGVDFSRLLVDNEPATRLQLALLLQDDTPGCQSGIYRKQDGSIILWHVEEDGIPGRFDQLRIATFRQSQENKNEQIHAFIYPDLLPGPAFCWSGNAYVQATDSLHLRHLPEEATMLANITTWVLMILGIRADPLDVIKALGPYWDGYAVVRAANQEGKINASVSEFAGTMAENQILDDQPGNFQYHGNALCDPAGAMAVKYESKSWAFRRKMEKRFTRTCDTIELQKSSDLGLDFFLDLVSSRKAGSWDYATPEVKAYFISRLSPAGLQIWLGPGPALKGETPIRL